VSVLRKQSTNFESSEVGVELWSWIGRESQREIIEDQERIHNNSKFKL